MADEDEREEELSSIAAIFPELIVDSDNPFAASIDLPVAPSSPLLVRFPAAPLLAPPGVIHGSDVAAAGALQDAHELEHLPPLHLRVVLPDAYPAESPPVVSLRTAHDWLHADKVKALTDECAKLWEEYGQCQILFAYIDFLQQSAERAFDLAEAGLDLDPSLKPALLDFDATTKKHIFDHETFDCGVCLEPKKGSSCHRLARCRHVFCLSCLQDFYNNCITEGDVVNVKCLDPGCGKEKGGTAEEQRRRKRKAERTLHPRELLAMRLDEAVVRRYVEMKRKKKLEADKSTVYCPRTWCQAPARSAKYPPLPANLALYPDSDSDVSDAEREGPPTSNRPGKPTAPSDRLSICSKCSFAFCRTCYAGWHGEFARCWPRNPSELSEEEKASYDYIRLHTSPCPTCSSPTQKTMGCNHMKCFQCNSHFCYLCGAWLDAGNPYQHFNKQGTGCFMRLWELEEGDEGPRPGNGNGDGDGDGDGAQRFRGARMWEEEARRVAEEADREEAMRLQDEENALAGALPAAAVRQPDHHDDDGGDDDDDDHNNNNNNNNNNRNRNRAMIMPEAPIPPPADLDPAFLAQMARLQAAPDAAQRPPPPAPHQHAAAVRNQARQRARRPPRGARGGGLEVGRGRGRGRDDAANAPRAGQFALPVAADPVAAAAFRRFVELAQRDEEDDWDSDELDEDGDEHWEIPVRAR
ncbi:hypothetical protein MBLNU459_g0919t1 [Dothideomycetes sp. NU459]